MSRAEAEPPKQNLQVWNYPRALNHEQRARWGKSGDYRRAIIALLSLPLDSAADSPTVDAIMGWALYEGQRIELEAESREMPDFDGLVQRLVAAIDGARENGASDEAAK